VIFLIISWYKEISTNYVLAIFSKTFLTQVEIMQLRQSYQAAMGCNKYLKCQYQVQTPSPP